jgi:hypothetical protein
MTIDNADLDRLLQAYKDATDAWVASIRAEEALATPDHSVHAWEVWEQAGFRQEEMRGKAKEAKEAYEAGLRLIDYDI